MSASTSPRRLQPPLRFFLFLMALLLIGGMAVIMRALFLPSQYLHAYKTVEQGPGHAADLEKLPILSFNHVLYLVGPVSAASGKKHQQLFPGNNRGRFSPSTFSDATGAVEILSEHTPESGTSLGGYFYNEPVHLLGWRTSRSGLTLFMIAQSREDLLGLLTQRSEHWQRVLLIQGLILLALVFVIFWFLNMALLSNVRIRLVQVLVVNIIFLIFLYSALLLTGYPLWGTAPYVLLILLLGNLVFVPMALLLAPRPQAPQGS
jgi:hypothetical protein